MLRECNEKFVNIVKCFLNYKYYYYITIVLLYSIITLITIITTIIYCIIIYGKNFTSILL